MAPGTHVGLIASEYGTGGGFGAIALPSTSGSGAPAIADWVEATLPNDPNGNAWTNGGAPHLVSAYVSPNTGKAMGVMANDSRTFIALIDIQALLNATRATYSLNFYPDTSQNGTGTITTGSHYVDHTVDLVATGVVTWIPMQ
jgi:hypothetical protein